MNNTFEIKRIQNYCKANGVNIDSEYYGDYFLFDDGANIYKWTLQIPQPSILELRQLYSDETIEREIALVHLRAYRNKYLRLTDSLIGDRIDNQDDVAEIRRFRRALRDLPASIDQKTLRLNANNKINIKRYFNKKNLPIGNNVRQYIKSILDETDI
jgi:hypothetical protein